MKRLLALYVFSLLVVGTFVFGLPLVNNLSQLSSLVPNSQSQYLPDLAPFPIYDLRLSRLSNGRTILKFSASFVNKGKRQFELIGDPNATGDTYRNVFQRIMADDGSTIDKVVGSFEWHAVHNHYHYSDFADYVFSSVKLTAGDKAPLGIRQKSTFCLRDNELSMPELPGAPRAAGFVHCTQNRQGVSVGWTDIYLSTLPDQYIDVNDMPAGIYSLSFFLDPNQRFIEEQKDNNISTVFFELDIARGLVRQIAAGAPFTTRRNTFPNGLLLSSGGDDAKTYVIHNNKKRWLRTSDIFASYNYSWDNIYKLNQGVIDAIPLNNLMRVKDTLEVYAVNDQGYRRHLSNPDVFNSYGFSWADISEINPTEFEIYKEAKLIMLTGTDSVYSISSVGKKFVGVFGNLSNLGYEQDSVHIINQVDFSSYPNLP